MFPSYFGRLREAAVKSKKIHIRHAIGSKILSLKIFCTILSQIEVMLNSRNLVIIFEDPRDFSVLIAEHFSGRDDSPSLVLPKVHLSKKWHECVTLTKEMIIKKGKG